MADTLRCSRCGAPLVASVPSGPCPACLLALAVAQSSGPLGAAAVAPVLPAAPARIGPYRILETLGEGGMGIVYLAEQDEPLRRRVAVKVIKLGMDTREVVARFDSERQAVALMDHPNIASVYDAGATGDGRPYFVMEYIPGIPITEYCDRHRLDTRARLMLFTGVCTAMQHAHQKGIIHRDLKPTNVLVMEQDGRAVPKVIDFGVAKAIDQRLTERTLFTAHGLLVGTPEYMSPEQASLGETSQDTRTDIYSLGVLLYELLVGALPFEIRGLRRAAYDELRRVIREEEPVRPSARVDTLGEDGSAVAEHRQTDTAALRRQLRGDLDWIVLKALEKDPARRYASASEFAADVGRHLGDEPVAASPPSAAYRLRKFTRKHKGPVAAIAAILIVLLAGFIVSTRLFVQADEARQQAQWQRGQAEHQRVLAESAARDAREQRDVASRQQHAAEAAGRETAAMFARAEDARVEADRQREEAQRRVYAANIGLADASLRLFNSSEAMRRLELTKPSLRGWEWRHLFFRAEPTLARLRPHGGFYRFPSPSSSFVFNVDGTRVMWNTDHAVHVWDARSYRPLATYGGRESILALGPDGALVAVASLQPQKDFTLRVIESESRKIVATLPGHVGEATHAAFSRDGRRIASAAADGIRVWDLPSARVVISIPAKDIRYVTFSPDGSRLAASSGNAGSVWKADSGELISTLDGHTRDIYALAFSPSGEHIASASADHTVRIWDAQSGRVFGVLNGHRSNVFSLTFSPDGTRLATGGYDCAVRLWDWRHSREVAAWPTELFCYVISVAFDRAGSRLFAGEGGVAGSGYVWDISAEAGVRTFIDAHAHRPIALAPDGTSLISGSERGTMRMWDLVHGRSNRTLKGNDSAVTSVAFNPSGTRLASGHQDGTLNMWDPATGRIVLTFRAHGAAVTAVAFSPGGAELASAALDKTVRIQDAQSGKSRAELQLDGQANAAVFTPDGVELLIGSENPSLGPDRPRLHRWHWSSGRVTPAGSAFPSGDVLSIAVRSGGKEVAVAGTGAIEPTVWDTQLKRRLGRLVGHAFPVWLIGFTPDGMRIVTGGEDGTARVWDADTYEPLLVLRHEGARSIDAVAVSPDGSRIATLAADRIYVRDTRSSDGLEAKDLVRRLFQQLVFSTDVVQHLQSDITLRPNIRDAAIQLAESIGDDPGRHFEESWKVVKTRDAARMAYRLALRRAELAVKLASWETGYVIAVGAAHYRLGEYQRTLSILTHDGASPSGASLREKLFIAMAHHQLGQTVASRTLLEELRVSFDTRKIWQNQELSTLFREAEALIAAPAKRPSR